MLEKICIDPLDIRFMPIEGSRPPSLPRRIPFSLATLRPSLAG